MNSTFKLGMIGICAGIINGSFGAGSGLILVPLLSCFSALNESEIFPASISIALSLSFISLIAAALFAPLPFREACPYLLGSAAGGLLAGICGSKVPVKWLHRVLGVLILWGGIRYIW